MWYVALIALFVSCVYRNKATLLDPDEQKCENVAVTYTAVASLLSAQCISCHNQYTQNGYINLEGYANVKTLADNGKLLCVVTHGAGCNPMPKNQQKLDNCTISKIENWIINGAKND